MRDDMYTNALFEEPPRKRRRILPLLALLLGGLILIGVGIGSYAILKPPSVGAALRRTASDLLGEREALTNTLQTLGTAAREEDTEMTWQGTLPAALTGAEPLTLSAHLETVPGERPLTRLSLSVSVESVGEVSLCVMGDGEIWWIEGLYPDERDRALFLEMSGLPQTLERSAWNPAVNEESIFDGETFEALLEAARAAETRGTEEPSYSEEERREVGKAGRALGKAWRDRLDPVTARSFSFSAGLSKQIRYRVDTEALCGMVDDLRRVMEEYPAFASLIASTVTFTEYGEELFSQDAVVEAALPDADVPQVLPLSAEKSGELDGDVVNDPFVAIDRLEAWLEEWAQTCDFETEIALTVCRGRLTELAVDLLYDAGEENREEMTLTLTFERPTEGEEEQTLATALLRGASTRVGADGLSAETHRYGEYLRYTLRQTEEVREYCLSFAEDPDCADTSDASPDPLSAEEGVSDPTAWESEARCVLRYDRVEETFVLTLEEKMDDGADFETYLALRGILRLSDTGKRLELGLREMTLPPAPEATEGETVKLDLSLIWRVREDIRIELPREGDSLTDMSAEQIRELLEAGFVQQMSDVISVAFGTGELLYTVDGVRLRDVAYYQSVGATYLRLYQDYYNRERGEALEHLCILDEEIGMYVLLDLDRTANYLAVNFLAEMSPRYEGAYHTGTMLHGRLEGHVFEEVPGVEATCETAGYDAYACAYCDETQREEIAAKGHRIEERTENRTYDDGRVRREIYAVCSVCGGGRDAMSYAWVGSQYHLAVIRDPNAQEVALAYGFSGDMSRGKMLTLPDAVLADGSYPVTAIRSDAFSSSEMYTLHLIRFGKNIRHVARGAFAGADRLQILVLYPTLQQIDEDAFAACTSLRKVYFCGTEAQWRSIRIASGNEPLTQAEIIFDHDGSFVGDELFDTAAASSSLRTLTANSRDGKQGEVLATHPDASRLTVLSTAAAQAVAYDADTDTVIVCGGYDSVGGTTTVSFFDAESGALKSTRTVPWRVKAMDAGSGYVAFGEAATPTVHLYRLSDGAEVKSYAVREFEHRNDYIAHVFIDGGTVVACNAEKHCYIDFYKIASDTHVQSERLYEPALALDRSSHTLAAINQNSSPRSIYFFDSRTGEQITWLWNVDTTAPLHWNGEVFETSQMSFTIAGEPVENVQSPAPSSVSGDTMPLDTVMSGSDYHVWTVAVRDRAQGTVVARLMMRTDQVTLSEPLAYYADHILRLGTSDRFLLWGEEYTQLLIVDLR